MNLKVFYYRPSENTGDRLTEHQKRQAWQKLRIRWVVGWIDGWSQGEMKKCYVDAVVKKQQFSLTCSFVTVGADH